MNCLRFKKEKVEPNVIQLRITYSANKYERIVELQSIGGDQKVCQNLITLFVKRISKMVRKIRTLRKSDNLDIDNYVINNEPEKENEKSFVEMANREMANHYEFYKILSQDNYDLGKSVKLFLEDFQKNTQILIRPQNVYLNQWKIL